MKPVLIVGILIVMVSLCSAQSFPIQSHDINFMLHQSEKPRTDAEIADAIQAMLIQELFLNKMMSSELQFFEDDDEDSTGIGSNKRDREMHNMMMSQILSKELAKQDLLKLRRYLLPRHVSNQSQEVRSVRR